MEKRVGLFITAILLGLTGVGQIVNVESKRPGATGEGWHGNLNLNLDFTRNTQDVLAYGFKNKVQYQKKKHRVLVLADLSRIRAGGADFVNSGYEHVRYSYSLGESRRFAIEAFQQAQFNSVQKIQFRHLSGAGLRWNVLERDSLKIRTGTLPMYEYEELTDGSIERNFRESTYFLFYIQLKGMEFQTINYYQPKWDDFADYRWSSATSLEFGLLRWLRYTVTFDLLYDSRVPEGVPDLVFTLKNGLGIEF